jgi:tRNA pseudouridine38-40 synthase
MQNKAKTTWATFDGLHSSAMRDEQKVHECSSLFIPVHPFAHATKRTHGTLGNLPSPHARFTVNRSTMPTQRYKLTLAYRGTRYHGWQKQPMLDSYRGEPPPQGQGIPTIQEVLARAIQGVVRHPINLVGSSRTDAGVHAKGQVAHFDTDQAQIPIEGIRRAVNHALPEDILVRTIEPVPDAFDAITSTASKRYQYFIWNAPDRPLFFPDLAWHRWQSLDVPAMAEAAKHFVGTHDFASFARPGHGRDNTTRTVLSCDVSHRAPRLLISVEGTGFLWHMVRIMVGTLVEVGLGRTSPQVIAEMLAARDRTAAGPTAPPQGLYLQWIKFREGEVPPP